MFLLNSADQLLEKKGEKKKKFDHEKHTSDEKTEKTPREKKLRTEFTTVLDPNIKPCEACGRQEKDRVLKVNHTFANCYLKSHPDANKDPKTSWKDSKNGKAYAAHKQSSPILPWSRVLIAGTEWKGLKGTSNESDKCFFFEN